MNKHYQQTLARGAARRKRVIEMHKAGKRGVEIARKTGVSTARVSTILKKWKESHDK